MSISHIPHFNYNNIPLQKNCRMNLYIFTYFFINKSFSLSLYCLVSFEFISILSSWDVKQWKKYFKFLLCTVPSELCLLIYLDSCWFLCMSHNEHVSSSQHTGLRALFADLMVWGSFFFKKKGIKRRVNRSLQLLKAHCIAYGMMDSLH